MSFDVRPEAVPARDSRDGRPRRSARRTVAAFLTFMVLFELDSRWLLGSNPPFVKMIFLSALTAFASTGLFLAYDAHRAKRG